MQPHEELIHSHPNYNGATRSIMRWIKTQDAVLKDGNDQMRMRKTVKLDMDCILNTMPDIISNDYC